MDFLDHYTLINDEEGHVGPFDHASALRLAKDVDHIWFVREGDVDEDCTCDEDEDCECDTETVWSVEPWFGRQFVNCLGFFVTTERRKPEHNDVVFTY